jgi:tetratricopeptide (TPR) repeat protein
MDQASSKPEGGNRSTSFGQLLGDHLLRGTRPHVSTKSAGRKWGKKEFAAAVGVSDRTVRFWLQDQHLPPEIETIERVLFGDDPTACAAWRLDLRQAHERTVRQKGDPPSAGQSISNLPYPSLGNLFKGRDPFLRRLRAGFVRAGSGRNALVSKAIHGLGGVGKTRAAVEYAHAYKDSYCAVLFVIADSGKALHHNFAALAGPLALDLPEQHGAEQAIRVRAVSTWLNAHPGWLLILDNLDARDAMAEAHTLIARLAGGHVIITTRLASFASYIEPIELEVLDRDASAEFLLQRTHHHRSRAEDDGRAARALGEHLGGLALALEQAGAFINRAKLGFVQYERLWRENWPRLALWADETVTHYPRAIAATWETSIARLGAPARRLLARLSWLAPEPVPYALLEVPLALAAPGPADATQHLEALDDLADYSMVRCNRVQGEFDIHRLVKDVTRRNLGEEADAVLVETIHWINAAFSGDPEEEATRRRFDRLHLHALALVDAPNAVRAGTATAELMNKLGDFAVSKALYPEARRLLEGALAMRESLLGPEHPDTAASLASLASLRLVEGDLTAARTLCERCLAIREKALGPNHPGTAIVLNNLLAGIVRAQGDLPAARAYCERALAIREVALGPEHPDTARSLNDLSSVLRDEGALARARLLCERALAIRQQVLGADHVDTARSLTSLALLQEAEGDVAGARPLHERALAIREKMFGPEHPHTARSLHHLARTVHALGDVARARALYDRALMIREKLLGPDHLDTAAILESVAGLVLDQGDVDGARCLLARIVAIRTNALGPEHADTLRAADRLRRTR